MNRPGRKAPPPTAAEMKAVCEYALQHPIVGYKRLAWQMVDLNVAYLHPYQVYRILQDHHLLAPGRLLSPPASLKRPPEPDHPDQIWHIDLMYLFLRPRWYYLVDILDGYGRFLVNWSLNCTMTADTVTLTLQQALEKLEQEGFPRHAGEPRMVHDHGSQFSDREWRRFIGGVGLEEIPTRVAHPQSNGRLERLHRTHRQECFSEEVGTYGQAVATLQQWATYYNHQRPHSALHYLPPAVYYRGDPQASLQERQEKMRQAAEQRQAYW